MKLFELENTYANFVLDHIDHHSGQDDYQLKLDIGGNIVGWIEFLTFEDDVAVSMIEVKDTRKGYGTSLVKELQRRYPATEIDFGMLTGDGSELISSLKFKTIKSPYYDQFIELEKLSQELEDASTRQEFDKMNDLNDSIDDLDDLLQDKSKYLKIIV